MLFLLLAAKEAKPLGGAHCSLSWRACSLSARGIGSTWLLSSARLVADG